MSFSNPNLIWDVRQFCDALSLFKLGFSWGGPVSLVMLYDLKDMRALEHTHLQQGLLVRFCMGLEHPADLIQDIENALKQLNNHHKNRIGRSMSTLIIIAKKTTNTQQDVVLHSKFANRHGLIAGQQGQVKP